jgi:hypothetical protein
MAKKKGAAPVAAIEKDAESGESQAPRALLPCSHANSTSV